MLPQFKLRQHGIDLLLGLLRVACLKRLLKSKQHIFLPVGDTLSLEPLAFGTYEYGVSQLMAHFSQQGYNEVMFDIGANIGLSTFYSKGFFKKVYCFEPNPVLFNVLKANTQSTSDNIVLFNFGLGPDEQTSTLRVPLHNVGGGYIDDTHNALSKAELAKKDGLLEATLEKHYSSIEVTIKRGRSVLGELLSTLHRDQGLLFKIDVEGYERAILREIGAALGPEQRAVIIFENFSETITPEFIRSTFTNVKSIGRLQTNIEKLPSKVLKGLVTLIMGRTYSVEQNPSTLIGEIIVTLG